MYSSVHLSVCLSTDLSIHLFTYPPIYTPTHPSNHWSIHSPMHLSTSLSTPPSLHPSVYPFISYLSIYICSFYLYIYTSAHPRNIYWTPLMFEIFKHPSLVTHHCHVTGECCTFWSRGGAVTVCHGNRDRKGMWYKVTMLVPINTCALALPIRVPSFWSSFLGDTFWMPPVLPALSPSQITVFSTWIFNPDEGGLGPWCLTASVKSDLSAILSQALALIHA